MFAICNAIAVYVWDNEMSILYKKGKNAMNKPCIHESAERKSLVESFLSDAINQKTRLRSNSLFRLLNVCVYCAHWQRLCIHSQVIIFIIICILVFLNSYIIIIISIVWLLWILWHNKWTAGSGQRCIHPKIYTHAHAHNICVSVCAHIDNIDKLQTRCFIQASCFRCTNSIRQLIYF